MIEIEAACDVCGRDSSLVSLTLTFGRAESSCLCDFCAGLVEAGMLRYEGRDDQGRPLYRRWIFEWRPGELVEQREAS